ncbi:hypothetical protein ASPZODRAFT_150184 [Penicilliopsis zonata CBS 506.65]|uniref:DUF159 domain protein n=1 Tax=Penicilliopsis zonata CBS 506.65 TaxID=1073090 RepID=A0A1L9SQ29_9EURO|nr:hypothetical protein ASPZODRAFT_150184 [Penicilliopsis zonata CBS 506.65]OJJ49278.1 hypothetical protein ASPZODRAFT_150184 [Penicilliopsis zonata CBS 506.65]
MCGRYALGVRLAFIQQRLEDQGMPVDDAAEDEDVRETYNFAPGNYGAVYRADAPDRGYGHDEEDQDSTGGPETSEKHEKEKDQADRIQKYKLQSMRWGLVPFWTKRQPDYGSLMRTINCRDDSLAEDRGMWTSMKRRKRCIVICQGFYEWLKKGPGGKEKIPHFIKRKDGDLMCFAGLWDCVSYEGADEKLYTYTVITTSSNPYLRFLHDRMPVILEPGSEAMKMWLDPKRTTWSKELQSILKPYEGDLECYQVPKEVGKVGNNSPDFIVPIDSKENKKNIANFFANAEKPKLGSPVQLKDRQDQKLTEFKVTHDRDEQRTTQDTEWSEDNAPAPVPGVKRERPVEEPDEILPEEPKKHKTDTVPSSTQEKGQEVPRPPTTLGRKTRSATRNNTIPKAVNKKPNAGSQRITNFFKK